MSRPRRPELNKVGSTSIKVKGDSLGKARAAREVLKAKEAELLEALIQTVVEARSAGEFEVATKTLIWLLEHMPADADGKRVVDVSVDKVAESGGSKGPTIQIGIGLGGMKQLPPVSVKELPPQEAELIEEKSST